MILLAACGFRKWRKTQHKSKSKMWLIFQLINNFLEIKNQRSCDKETSTYVDSQFLAVRFMSKGQLYSDTI